MVVTIGGEAGGDWFVRRQGDGWTLFDEIGGRPPTRGGDRPGGRLAAVHQADGPGDGPCEVPAHPDRGRCRPGREGLGDGIHHGVAFWPPWDSERRVEHRWRLLSDDTLERSAVVANCRMNRERNLLGSNGYDRELGFNPLDFLKERIATGHPVAWLDLCCGTGRAMIQAAEISPRRGAGSRSRSWAWISSGCSTGPTPP